MKNDYGVQRAINELLAIFAGQWSNGMLPQIRFVPGEKGYRPDADDWGAPALDNAKSGTPIRTSGITQPPIIGMCAYEVFRKLSDEHRQAHIHDFLLICQRLERYHDWLFRERDPWGEHLALCLHPWETGTDNSPAFDALIDDTRTHIEKHNIPVDTFGRADTSHVKGEHRPTDRDYRAYFGLVALFKKHGYDQKAIIEHSPFLLQDVLFNTLFAVSLQSLAQLQLALVEICGDGQSAKLTENAGRNRARSGEVASAIRRKLWSEGDDLFYSYDSRGDRLLTTSTVSSLLPLMGDIATTEQAECLLTHLANSHEFWTEMPVPSTSAASRAFNPVRYWSGPSWPVTNWLVLRGLRERGSPLAEALRISTLNMIAEGVNQDKVREAAIQVLELNSVGEAFTTPSRKQYSHAWLWDSAIVALSWPSVQEKPGSYDPQPDCPQFWEYYHPRTGEPLGAPLMSWTASLFLELHDMKP